MQPVGPNRFDIPDIKHKSLPLLPAHGTAQVIQLKIQLPVRVEVTSGGRAGYTVPAKLVFVPFPAARPRKSIYE